MLSGVNLIYLLLILGILLIFEYFRRKKLRRDFYTGNLSECTRREFGQVTGLSDAKKVHAKHGIVVDLKTGRYYSQHRHTDSTLTRINLD